MGASHLDAVLGFIKETFPKSHAEIVDKDLINPNLFSPLSLQLPGGVLKRAKEFVSTIYQLKESAVYTENISEVTKISGWPKTPSLLTCFDFHYSEEMGLKLIEVNTNASLYIPALIQRHLLLHSPIESELSDLLDSFVTAFDLSPGDSIDIFDEKPTEEGLFLEFLIYQEWLIQNGYESKIRSLAEIDNSTTQNIYNRYTDFYLEKPQSQNLKEDYIAGKKALSPNPREYFLLADKKRLNAMKDTLEEKDSDLAAIIPESKLFSEFESKEDLWSQRKKYFFKPSQSFGSKGVFSGKGISKKAFENLYAPDFMAQELCPAGRRLFDYQNEEIEMKFDLRFFTFEGRVQNYTARLYQGQATNMRTQWGGVAPIEFI